MGLAIRTLMVLAILFAVRCDRPTYTALGMEVYVDASGPSRLEFIAITTDYLTKFKYLFAADHRATLKNLVVEFYDTPVICGDEIAAGCYTPGLIKIHYATTLRASAWAHELGHHFHVVVRKRPDKHHTDAAYWSAISSF